MFRWIGALSDCISYGSASLKAHDTVVLRALRLQRVHLSPDGLPDVNRLQTYVRRFRLRYHDPSLRRCKGCVSCKADATTGMSVSPPKADLILQAAKRLKLAEAVEELCCHRPAYVIPFLCGFGKEHGNDGISSRTARQAFLRI
jgi:hypothetical protein